MQTPYTKCLPSCVQRKGPKRLCCHLKLSLCLNLYTHGNIYIYIFHAIETLFKPGPRNIHAVQDTPIKKNEYFICILIIWWMVWVCVCQDLIEWILQKAVIHGSVRDCVAIGNFDLRFFFAMDIRVLYVFIESMFLLWGKGEKKNPNQLSQLCQFLSTDSVGNSIDIRATRRCFIDDSLKASQL